jgi:hypothetical protein
MQFDFSFVENKRCNPVRFPHFQVKGPGFMPGWPEVFSVGISTSYEAEQGGGIA